MVLSLVSASVYSSLVSASVYCCLISASVYSSLASAAVYRISTTSSVTPKHLAVSPLVGVAEKQTIKIYQTLSYDNKSFLSK